MYACMKADPENNVLIYMHYRFGTNTMKNAMDLYTQK
jgi:hypothetical protein